MRRTSLGLAAIGAVLVIAGGLGLGWLYWGRASPVGETASDSAASDAAQTGETPTGGGTSATAPVASPERVPRSGQGQARSQADAEPASAVATRAGGGERVPAAAPRRVPTVSQGDAADDGPGLSLIVPGPQPPGDGSEPHARQMADHEPRPKEALAPQAAGASSADSDGRQARANADDEPTPASEAASASEPPAEADTVAAPAPSEEQPRPPRFDVVRVDPDGQTVIAGQAPPGAQVILERESGEVLGATRANENGEFVLVPQGPLASGAHALSLRAETDQGSQRSAQGMVAVIPTSPGGLAREGQARPLPVPESPEGDAGEPIASAPKRVDLRARRRPLVMMVPREESAETASQIVQQPALPEPAGGRDRGGEGGDAGRSRDARTDLTPVGPIPGEGAVPPPNAVPAGASSADESVRVDIIEYGQDVPLDVRGEATPGADVEAYLEGEKIGEARADRRGDWRIKSDRPVPPGDYRLRVDRLAPGGDVAARLVMPFERAEPPSPDTRNDFIIVQPGHNLWTIARRIYGSGVRYTQIYEANATRIADPDLIYPGQVFQLPRDTSGQAASRR